MKCKICDGLKVIPDGAWATMADAMTCSHCEGTGKEPTVFTKFLRFVAEQLQSVNVDPTRYFWH